MKIQYKPSMLTKGPLRYRYIIVHDTNCMWKEFNEFKVDTPQSQTNKMRSQFKILKKYDELPYHFVCELVRDDYETVVSRPLQFAFIYKDLPASISKFAIHVCVMGNYNIIGDDVRMYQQLCYRVLSPMMRVYHIPKTHIYLHGELSSTQMDCPGLKFDKNKLISYLPPFSIVQ